MPAAWAGLASAAIGAYSSSQSGKKSGDATSTQQQQLDPRISDMLFGAPYGTTDSSLLGRYQNLLNAPQSDAMKQYGTQAGDYLTKYGAGDMGTMHNAASGLLGGMSAPQAAPATGYTNRPQETAAAISSASMNTAPNAMQGAHVNAPGQNGMDLTNAYGNFIGGDPGANPYLTGAIQKGINQSSNAFGNYVTDAKKAAQEMLGGIRSDSVLAGQYGGSRQGIAEGKAIDSMNTNLARAASQFGQNNTDAAVSAQAGAYDTDRNRALSATQGLGAQQYGVAAQDSSQAQQANSTNYAGLLQSGLANQAANNGMSQYNAGLRMQNDFHNADYAQQANQFNAGLTQQTNLANQQAQMQTNQLNSANTTQGFGLLGGLLGSAQSTAQNQDAYGLTRAQGVNGLLAPYLSANATNVSSQPLYQNTAGNMLGGAAAGLGLYNQYQQAAGGYGRNQDNYGVNTGAGTSSMLNMQRGGSSLDNYQPSSGGNFNNWDQFGG